MSEFQMSVKQAEKEGQAWALPLDVYQLVQDMENHAFKMYPNSVNICPRKKSGPQAFNLLWHSVKENWTCNHGDVIQRTGE